MIEVEGYKAFRGKMKIIPHVNMYAPFELMGDFLYKPDTGCWYHNGHSYSESICCVKHDETEEAENA